MKNKLKKIKHRLKLWKNSKLLEKEYREFLINEQNFNTPADFESKFAERLIGIREFDLVDDTLNGSLQKRFVMLDKYAFKNYLNEVKTTENNTSYVTYLDEEDIKNDVYPQKLSALIKIIGMDYYHYYSEYKESTIKFYKRAFSEVLSPKILNYFNCFTTYNRIIVDDNIYIVSLDFIKPHQKFYPINEISEKPVFSNYISKNNIEILIKKIKELQKQIFSENIKNKKSLKFPKCNEKTIIEDYIYSWLVRILVLGDMDFCSRNYGLIYDAEKNEIISAPNFDFEWVGYAIVLDDSLKSKYSWDFNIKKLIGALSYIYDNYPSIYEKFIKVVKNLYETKENGKQLIDEIIENTISEGFKTEFGIAAAQNSLETIKANINEILKFDLKLSNKKTIQRQ